MNRYAVIAMLIVAGIARAQNMGPGNPSGYAPAPNSYNRQSQPLSPYLNLLRGGNNAVNYFYGARPGTVGGGGFAGMMNQQNVGPRQTFFPVVDTLADLLTDDQKGLPRMPATGHPVGFGNTLNYFGPSTGSAQRGAGPQPQRRSR